MAERDTSFAAGAAELDRITLTGLTAYAYHGVEEFEKEEGQVFSIDVSYWLDTRQAGITDNLQHTINYAEVAETVHHLLTGCRFDLVETLAHHIAHQLLHDHPLMRQVEVCVHKPSAPIPVTCGDVAVTIRRTRLDLERPA